MVAPNLEYFSAVTFTGPDEFAFGRLAVSLSVGWLEAIFVQANDRELLGLRRFEVSNNIVCVLATRTFTMCFELASCQNFYA
jgi:hypothetical protein